MAKCNGCIHNAVCTEWSEEGLFPNISQERSPLNRAMQVGDYDCPYYAGDTYRSIRFATVGDNELVKYRGEAPMSEIFELLGADDLVWLYVTKQTIADVTERLDDMCVTDAIYNAIQELPTADVMEVVRCKDCIYNPLTANEKGFFICQASMMEITDNDYCSYGTRMDGEDE